MHDSGTREVQIGSSPGPVRLDVDETFAATATATSNPRFHELDDAALCDPMGHVLPKNALGDLLSELVSLGALSYGAAAALLEPSNRRYLQMLTKERASELYFTENQGVFTRDDIVSTSDSLAFDRQRSIYQKLPLWLAGAGMFIEDQFIHPALSRYTPQEILKPVMANVQAPSVPLYSATPLGSIPIGLFKKMMDDLKDLISAIKNNTISYNNAMAKIESVIAQIPKLKDAAQSLDKAAIERLVHEFMSSLLAAVKAANQLVVREAIFDLRSKFDNLFPVGFLDETIRAMYKDVMRKAEKTTETKVKDAFDKLLKKAIHDAPRKKPRLPELP